MPHDALLGYLEEVEDAIGNFKSHRRGGEDLTRFLTLTTFSNNQTNKICPVKFFEEGSEADFTGALNKSKIEDPDPIGLYNQ